MPGDLIEIDAARAEVLRRATPLPAQAIQLRDALGRTLAVPVSAAEQVPGFDNSAMDGYAVRAADLAGASRQAPLQLPVEGESRAGAPAEDALSDGSAIAISTGAVVPRRADTVVRVEDTEVATDGAVNFMVAPEAGANVRRAGDDIEPGTELLRAGAELGPAELGVLASVGVGEVDCHRRPTVAQVSTGDELIGLEDELVPGAVRNSNAFSLPALATRAGAEPASVSRAGDTHAATVEALAAGLEADVLVVSGGVSVGEHDHVKPALAELGVEEHFWGVSLKPGKPTFFGSRGETLVFGLPGNPVSAFVTFLLFARPALVALRGSDPRATRTEAVLARDYEKPADRAHALRCTLELTAEGWRADPAPHQGSHVMTSLLGADALALIPAATTRAAAGERVTVELLP